MDKSVVKFAKTAGPSLLVWKVPSSLLEEGPEGIQVFALPLMSCPGGDSLCSSHQCPLLGCTSRCNASR